MLEHHRDGRRLLALGRQQRMADAAEFRDRHADLHADAAHRAPQHHALAVELDLADLPVRPAVARRIAHGQGEGVEPQRAARPRGPVDTHVDASNSPRRAFLPGRDAIMPPEPSESA